MKKMVLVILLCLGLSPGLVNAQEGLLESLEALLDENAERYLQPFADGFGANLNSGYYHKAKPHKLLGFDIGAKAMLAAIPDESMYYEFVMAANQLSIPVDQTIDLSQYGLGSATVDKITLGFDEIFQIDDPETPTLLGPAGGSTLSPNTTAISGAIQGALVDELVAAGLTEAQAMDVVGTEFDVSALDDAIPASITLPGGIDLPALPLFMPQIAVGLPLGIELIARGVPELDLPSDLGQFSAMGGGLRISIDQFIPVALFPVDITAGMFFQGLSLTVDEQEIISATNTSFGLQVGKELNLLIFGLGLYGDIAFESSTLDIGYTAMIADEEVPVEFSMETEGGLRFGAGAHLKLIPLTYLHVGFSQTPTNQVMTAGFGISFR